KIIKKYEPDEMAIETLFFTSNQKTVMDVPDLVVIALGLNDISGDVAIGKLKRIEKTKDVKYILYTERSGERAKVTQRISEKEGINKFVEFIDEKEILDASDLLFQ
ncbi:MAG: crossover junction endodeoxyribonuclease RuvC, partial [Candidatus Omnitrophica bacterium]|nr:crossover junction endodeoxyribonuclease RuvC [Candidatus Omnitrophota bacterium]